MIRFQSLDGREVPKARLAVVKCSGKGWTLADRSTGLSVIVRELPSLGTFRYRRDAVAYLATVEG